MQLFYALIYVKKLMGDILLNVLISNLKIKIKLKEKEIVNSLRKIVAKVPTSIKPRQTFAITKKANENFNRFGFC